MFSNARLPEYNDVFGENKKRIFEIFGVVTGNSEYASEQAKNDFLWALQPSSEGSYCVDNCGEVKKVHYRNPFIGVRPCMNYSDMEYNAKEVYNFGDGLKLVEYGSYPKRELTGEELNAFYALKGSDLIKSTGKTYHRRADSVEIMMDDGEPKISYGSSPYFTPYYRSDSEYVDVYGNKYVECKGKIYLVQPILWLVDEYENYAVTEEIITGGVPVGMCQDPLSTSKLQCDFFSVALYVSRLVGFDLYDSYTKYTNFPSLNDRRYEFLKYRYPFLNGLSNNLTEKEYLYLEEMVAFYANKKEEYYHQHSFR